MQSKRNLSSNFIRFFSLALCAAAMLAPLADMAADNSSVNAQGSASSSPTESNDNEEFQPHLILGRLTKSPEYDLSSTSDPNARCRKSTLTQEKFLEMLKAIIKHGDLTDKAFIEETLNMKFDPRVLPSIYKHVAGGGIYEIGPISEIENKPISIMLDIGLISSEKPILSSELLLGHLDRVGAIFHNCKYLTPEQFDQKFSSLSSIRHPLFRIRGGLGGLNNAGIKLENVGKNSTSISVEYEYRTKDNFITQISITQKDSDAHSNK